MQYVEAVTRGQSDAMCNQIADAILDEYLRRDPASRVALTVSGSRGMVVVTGEVLSKADFDVADVVKRVYREIGYLDDIEPLVNITSDIQAIPNHACIAMGYATSATPQMMPKPFVVAQAVAKRIDDLRLLDADFSWLRPDGRVLVGFQGKQPKRIAIDVQHDEQVDEALVRTRLFDRVVVPLLGSESGFDVDVNRGGTNALGGFQIAAGISGSHLERDTYGGLLPWASGVLSGRDPRYIDRCSAYMCRYVAKQLVARGVGKTILIDAVYARDVVLPVFLRARTGEGKDVTSSMNGKFDFRADAIVERLQLRAPMYKATAQYGQFGREGFPWEHIEQK